MTTQTPEARDQVLTKIAREAAIELLVNPEYGNSWLEELLENHLPVTDENVAALDEAIVDLTRVIVALAKKHFAELDAPTVPV